MTTQIDNGSGHDAYARKMLKMHEDMKSARSPLHGTFQEVVDYVRPSAGSFITPSGESPNQPNPNGIGKMYDDTAVDSLHKFSTGVVSMTCRPDDLWFMLSTGDQRLDDRDDVRLWLWQVMTAMYDIFAAPNYGFYPSAHRVAMELGSFGTCITGQFSTPKRKISFNTRFLGECYVAQDGEEDIVTVSREFKVPARSFEQMFGWVPAIVQRSLDGNRPNDTFTVVCMVTPRADADRIEGSMHASSKPFTHDYFLVQSQETLKRGGHDEFPHQVPRWMIYAGDTYGRSPAIEALPSIRMLNQMAKDNIRVGNLAADPAWQVPDDGFMLPLRTSPRSVNYYRAGSDDRAEPLRKDYSGVPFAYDLQNQRQQMVQRMFYTDLMLSVMNKNKEMTALETQQVVEEQARLVVPYIIGLQKDWLSPTIDRVFSMAYRAGMFPPPPDVLRGVDLVVQYRSPITQAQRSVYAIRLQRAMSLITPLAQVDMSVLDNLNPDRTTRWLLGDVFDIPQAILNSEDEVAQIRQARAKVSQEETAKSDMLDASIAYKNKAQGDAAAAKAAA